MLYLTPTNRYRFFTDFNDQSGADEGVDELVIPADLDQLTDEALAELHSNATEAFTALYNDGNPSQSDLEALGDLTEGLEAILAEQTQRGELAAQRAEQAAALAARVGLSVQNEDNDGDNADDDSDDEDEDKDTEGGDDEEEGSGETETLARRERRFRQPRRQLPPSNEDREQSQGIRDVMHAAGKGTTFTEGQGIDWMDAARITDQRYARFKPEQFATAARTNRQLKEQHPIATITKPIPDELKITSTDNSHVFEVIQRAADESRLSNGSLVAAGGWCAPSEVIYDLLELESRDGIYSLPEVGMPRGGIIRSLGPDFSELYAQATGFSYTEEQDIAGTYGVDANGVGDGSEGGKPCITLDCPDFDEFRLGIEGICVNAGILAQRGYPEAIARTLRGIMVAHDHRVSGAVLASVVAGSTAQAMPSGPATSQILGAVEMQVEHYRYKHRVARNTTFEAVFPFWVRPLIRADLARRDGLDVFSVTDAQINAWFTLRGIAPQFVYNWQDLPTTAMDVWPTTVSFLLYPAGTWVRGTSDIITLESLFDSALLAQNQYNALFTEEGYVVFNMNHDSRVVEVPLDASGIFRSPEVLGHNGTVAAAGTGA